jgi:hypothetical protein
MNGVLVMWMLVLIDRTEDEVSYYQLSDSQFGKTEMKTKGLVVRCYEVEVKEQKVFSTAISMINSNEDRC